MQNGCTFAHDVLHDALLRCRRRFVGEELQALLAGDDVELLSVVEGQVPAFPSSVDVRCRGTGDCKHIRTQIDPDDVAGFAEPLPGKARHNPYSTRDVENSIAGK